MNTETRSNGGLPAPTGPCAVARAAYCWDGRRTVSTREAGGARDLVVWIWYPAEPPPNATTAEYLPGGWAAAGEFLGSKGARSGATRSTTQCPPPPRSVFPCSSSRRRASWASRSDGRRADAGGSRPAERVARGHVSGTRRHRERQSGRHQLRGRLAGGACRSAGRVGPAGWATRLGTPRLLRALDGR
jgi:hypothetical protein